MEILEQTLAKINAYGLHTQDSLLSNKPLYTDIFIDVDRFITETVFHSHDNANKLAILKHMGVDIEDIHMDCLERIISKLDEILSTRLEQQIPYMYTICNNTIIDTYSKTVRETLCTISLDEALIFHKTIYS